MQTYNTQEAKHSNTRVNIIMLEMKMKQLSFSWFAMNKKENLFHFFTFFEFLFLFFLMQGVQER